MPRCEQCGMTLPRDSGRDYCEACAGNARTAGFRALSSPGTLAYWAYHDPDSLSDPVNDADGDEIGTIADTIAGGPFVDPETAAICAERARALAAAIEQLAPGQRAAVRYRFGVGPAPANLHSARSLIRFAGPRLARILKRHRSRN